MTAIVTDRSKEYSHPRGCPGKGGFIWSPCARLKGRREPCKPLPAPGYTLRTWQDSTPHFQLAHSMSFPMNFFWSFKKRYWYC